MTTAQHCRPRVHFGAKLTVQYVESHANLSVAERDSYWYKATEIEAFHNEARSDCRKLRKAAGLPASTIGPCRGLELRRSLARQKRKRLTLHFVAIAAKKARDPHQLARLACRCTEWPVKVAHAEAQRDFLRAYADDKIVQFHLPPLPPMTPFPLPLKGISRPATPPPQDRKRCATEPESCNTERRVRQRTSCY